MKTTYKLYYNLARSSPKKKKDVLAYYKRAIKLANYNNQREQAKEFKQQLAIINKIIF